MDTYNDAIMTGGDTGMFASIDQDSSEMFIDPQLLTTSFYTDAENMVVDDYYVLEILDVLDDVQNAELYDRILNNDPDEGNMADQFYTDIATDSNVIHSNSEPHAEYGEAIDGSPGVEDDPMNDAEGIEEEASNGNDDESDAEGTPEYDVADAFDQPSPQDLHRETATKTPNKPVKQQLRRSARVKTLDAAKAKMEHDHAIVRREAAVAQGLRRSGRLVGL